MFSISFRKHRDEKMGRGLAGGGGRESESEKENKLSTLIFKI